MDDESGQCISGAATGRDERGPANACLCTTGWKTRNDSSAAGDDNLRCGTARRGDPAGKSGSDLRAGIRSAVGVGTGALLSVSALVLPAGSPNRPVLQRWDIGWKFLRWRLGRLG